MTNYTDRNGKPLKDGDKVLSFNLQNDAEPGAPVKAIFKIKSGTAWVIRDDGSKMKTGCPGPADSRYGVEKI